MRSSKDAKTLTRSHMVRSTALKQVSSAQTPQLERILQAFGQPLTAADYKDLESSWITPKLADAAKLRRVSDAEAAEIVGQKAREGLAGIIFPYYWPDSPYAVCNRLRRDNPDYEVDHEGKRKQMMKYLGEPKSGNRLHVPPGVTLGHLADTNIPIVVVEGEKKTLALSRLSYHDSCKPRFIPIGISGVWNWRGVVGKTIGPNGERKDEKGPIPDLRRIEWMRRQVYVLFDTNVHTNESVASARSALTADLTKRKAKVSWVNMPVDCGVNGVDDLLAIWGPERVLELIDAAVLPDDSGHTSQFVARNEGIFQLVGAREIQLTNYAAKVVANLSLDNGAAEPKREFEIEAEFQQNKFRTIVTPSDFNKMEWPLHLMGAGAVTYSPLAKIAIQSFSQSASEKRIYTHTGWRKIDGQWIYLHANGGISGSGAVTDVDVRLCGSLERYALELPTSPEQLTAALEASLRLVELGPAVVSFPLRAATFCAVIEPSDFSIHLVGESGVFKSETAALEQQHFGSGMMRTNLPASWCSTGNAIEDLAFQAKDALMVIDDFAPQGNKGDVQRYHAVADRVLRAVGNHAGRARLDASAVLREPKPPRCLILSTGEEVPRGHSIRARMLVLELDRGAISKPALLACQGDAKSGLYAIAMGAFISWLATDLQVRRTTIAKRIDELRIGGSISNLHARTPMIILKLQAAFELFVGFCTESGVIDEGKRIDLCSRCWKALHQVGADQSTHQSDTEPTERYLELLRSLFGSGGGHLAGPDGAQPSASPAAFGWRAKGSEWAPQGDCLGWLVDDKVYLDPSATYRAIQRAGCDAGEAFAVSPTTMNRRLNQKGLLESTDAKRGTVTVRKTILGHTKNVLVFSLNTIFPADQEPEN